MTDEFGIWEVDEATKVSERLEEAGRTGTEAVLEDILVENPAMLMPGLELVGRQVQTANGPLDLLGVDSEGRLVLFELKRGTLRRKAVAQAVDYASWLDSLDNDGLYALIGENSGRRGIGGIENFEEWYGNNDNWESLESLRPVRIVLVGLGVDAAARRMVDWLAAKDVEIDLLTFMGYRHGNRMLLARQLDHSDEVRKQQKQVRVPRAEKDKNRLDAINRKIDGYEMRDWWPDAVAMLQTNCRPSYRAKSAITFYQRRRRTLSTGAKARGTYKIEISDPGVVRIVFLPAAVDLCLEEFERLRRAVPFNPEPPGRWLTTEQVKKAWPCRLDESGWQEHKDSIAGLVRMVDERWREAAG